MPDATYADVRRVAHVAHEVLDELGATGWPKTSGGKGMHVYVRIAPEHGFADVRRAAHAFAREVGRRCDLVDLTWWRKDRNPASIFVDYNQNTRDHTIRSAYSVRGVPEAVVSTPIRWDEIDDAEPGDFTIATVPARFAELGDLHAGIDDAVFLIDELLEWADRDAHDGADDPPEPVDLDAPAPVPRSRRRYPRGAVGNVPSTARSRSEVEARQRRGAGGRTRRSGPGAGSAR